MKLIKSLALGALALAVASVASAATLKITGSSAFRKALYDSILASGYTKAAYVGSSLNGSNQAAFFNGTDYIQTCIAGSVGGVNWVANNINAGTSPTASKAISWINPTGGAAWATPTIGAAPTYTITGGTQLATSQSSAPLATWEGAGVGAGALADVTMSDSYQDSTAYSAAATGQTLTDVLGGVGVVPFVFAKGLKHASVPQASYDRFTNVSALAFQNLAANGVAPLSTFTGNSADAGIDVVLTGRDNDSGTRLATNFETGFGNVDTYMFQYQPFAGATDAGTGTGLTINSFTAFNLGTGQAGYASGGSVKNVLLNAVTGNSPNGNPYIILGYLGEGDSPTAGVLAGVGSAGQELKYNGQTYGSDLYAVQNANYTFWTVEHMYYRSSLSTAKQTVAGTIATALKSTYATAYASGILLPSMNCSRSSEGTVVSPN